MNLKTVLLVIALVLAGLAVCVALGYFGVYPFTVIYDYAVGWMGGFNITEVASNPASILTTVGAAAAVATPLLAKLSTAKQQASDLKEQATTQISGLTGQLSTAKNELSSTETSLASLEAKFKSLEASTGTYQAQAEAYKTQLDKLTNQYTELQKIKAADFISTLPGGSKITNPDGSQTAVVERVVVK